MREALWRLHRHGQAAQRALAAVRADGVARARAPAALGGSMAGDGFVARHSHRRRCTGGGRAWRVRAACAEGPTTAASSGQDAIPVCAWASGDGRGGATAAGGDQIGGESGAEDTERIRFCTITAERWATIVSSSRSTTPDSTRALDAWGVPNGMGWIRNKRRLRLRLSRPLKPASSCIDADGSPPSVLPLSQAILSLLCAYVCR